MSENALQKIEPMPVTPSVVEPMTSAQAKIDAVANLTMKAYERASTLTLTPEEIAALKADFPDEAFQPGAAGKEHLIYIEHAHLRDRLNQVFNPGQWAIIPRNRWAEDFSTAKGTEASRVYVEAMLCIRGCFVAEAVGDMVYYKNNDSQNYGDAVEGAKSAALRRCAKELGIGLQAWKKEFCEGWWARKRGTAKGAAGKTAKSPAAPKATEKTRAWFLSEMRKLFPEKVILQWGVYHSEPCYLMPDEHLEDWPLSLTPTSRSALQAMIRECSEFMNVEPTPQKAAEPSRPPSTSDPGNQNSPDSQPDAPEGRQDDSAPAVETVVGKLEFVSETSGRSNKGPWTSYGLKIGGTWYNTFSKPLGKCAIDDKGHTVRIQFRRGDKGNDLVSIERAKSSA